MSTPERRRPSTAARGKFRALCLCLCLALLVSGCQEELYNGLPEEEANLMLVTLLENGLPAEKVPQGKAGFAVTVEKADMVRSLNLLKSHGLPQEKYQNLGQIFSGQGMIASPTEEQARLAFATSQELAETFSRIDGVLTARTHVVLARHDAATGQTTPSSAAVFIRHQPDSPVADLQGKIKEICAKAIPGLDYERVSVMLVPVREILVWPEGGAAAAPQGPLQWALRSGLPFLLGLSVFFILQWKRRRRAAAPPVEK